MHSYHDYRFLFTQVLKPLSKWRFKHMTTLTQGGFHQFFQRCPSVKGNFSPCYHCITPRNTIFVLFCFAQQFYLYYLFEVTSLCVGTLQPLRGAVQLWVSSNPPPHRKGTGTKSKERGTRPKCNADKAERRETRALRTRKISLLPCSLCEKFYFYSQENIVKKYSIFSFLRIVELSLSQDTYFLGIPIPLASYISSCSFMSFSQVGTRTPAEYRRLLVQYRGQQTFPEKGPKVNSFGFGGHTVSVMTTQLYCCNVTKQLHTIHKWMRVTVVRSNFTYKQQVAGGLYGAHY